MSNDDEAWFEPKRYGYGAGLPIRRQGWVLLGVYLAVAVGSAAALVERAPVAFAAILVIATGTLLAICAAKTRGGWRWRWGE